MIQLKFAPIKGFKRITVRKVWSPFKIGPFNKNKLSAVIISKKRLIVLLEFDLQKQKDVMVALRLQKLDQLLIL